MDNVYDAAEFYACLIFIMDHYGFDHQVYEKLPEEVDELNTAFDEYFKKPSPEHWHHIIEECADVHIMIEQFQMLITPEDKKEFDKICMDKLHREVGRIEGGMKNEKTQIGQQRPRCAPSGCETGR